MKILHTVEFYFPSSGGAQEVVRQISERMVKMGHDVTVATSKLPERSRRSINGVKIEEFAISGKLVEGIEGEANKYQDFLINSQFDIVMNYAAQQWTTDLMFDVLDKIKSKKVIVPCGYSALYSPLYKDYFDKLPMYLQKYDASVYMAKDYRDINFAKKHHLKNIRFIPNGADETEFSNPLSRARKKQLKKKYSLRGLVVMTIANYTGEKGHEELIRVFKRLPVPLTTLVSAGSKTPGINPYDSFKSHADRINSSPKFTGKRVVMLDGSKREDVRDLLKLADIFLFFSNIECSPLVLFEAAAAGVPFVATAAGNSKEIATWTKGGIIVKSKELPNGRVSADINDTLKKITKLAYSPLRRKSMGRTAHRIWKENYTWEKLTKEYLSLYEDLVENEVAE